MKRRFISIGYIASLLAQILLFFMAVSALTLLYLTYRHNYFLPSFVVVGLILIVPWLFISLLPTILVLKDKDLRRELLWSQLITMLIAFIILCGISMYIDFDVVILAQLKVYLKTAGEFLSDIVSVLISFFQGLLSLVISFYMETIVPIFSG